MSEAYADYPEPPRAGYRFNFAGKRPAETELLPKGQYVVTITKVSWSKTSDDSKTPGAPMLAVTYRVAAGAHEGHELEARYFPTSEAAGDFFYSLCAATGNWADDDWQTDLGAEEIDKRLAGATVVIPVSRKASDFSKRPDGLRNEVGQAFALGSPAGRRAADAAGYDDRLP